MTWWRIILGLPEKTDKCEPAKPATYTEKYKKMPACDGQKAFMHDNWNAFPPLVQEHIKRYDEIKALEKERCEFNRKYAYSHERIMQNIDILKEARDVGYRAYGVSRLIREYEAQLFEMEERLMNLPEGGELRRKNRIIEEKMKEQGWSCTYGTGGLHWNKKGVIEDGYGVYD